MENSEIVEENFEENAKRCFKILKIAKRSKIEKKNCKMFMEIRKFMKII